MNYYNDPKYDRFRWLNTENVLLALLLLFFLGIGINAHFDSQKPKPPFQLYNQPEIIAYDNCQYIVNRTAHGYFTLSHKGNCTNLIHIYK